MLVYLLILIQTCFALPINANILKSGLLTALIANSGNEAEIGMQRVSSLASIEMSAQLGSTLSKIDNKLQPEIKSLEKEISKNLKPSNWHPAFTKSIPSHSAPDLENWMAEMINGSPKVFQDLKSYLYKAITSPVKHGGDIVQGRVAAQEAERILAQNFGWVPLKFKPDAKSVLTDSVYEFINLVCFAKSHPNRLIKSIGEGVQKKLVSLNPNPKLASAFFKSICTIKALK